MALPRLIDTEHHDRDGTRRPFVLYHMLPPHHAQRYEYENAPPSLWKHKLLPRWIRETEARIAAVAEEGKAVATSIPPLERTVRQLRQDKAKKSDIEHAEEALGKAKGKRFGLEIEYRELSALVAAYKVRYAHGVTMFGEVAVDKMREAAR